MRRKLWLSALLILVTCLFAGCGEFDGPQGGYDYLHREEENFGDSFQEIVENPFVSPTEQADSTFSLDANTAAYSVMRRRILEGSRVDTDAVRIEEYINDFNYPSYPLPAGEEALRLNANVYACPWNPEHELLRVGLKTQAVDYGRGGNNLVLLIDVSGSMYGPDRLDLVKESFRMLLNGLGEEDTVSIMTYASGTRIVLEGVPGSDKKRIADALENLKASGTTAGEAGLRLAYQVAQRYEGNSRILLATDGDFNVGFRTPREMETFIIRQREEHDVYLSILGFGMGNLKDDLMESIAKNGNGSRYYIDSREEAYRVMVENVGGTLHTVARDAKALVRFDPRTVSAYRLIGYENKRITVEEYEDPETDAGEIGAGLTVTALYEIVPLTRTGIVATAEVSYKSPDLADETVRRASLACRRGEQTEDDTFVAGVAEFGLLLRDSRYQGSSNFGELTARLSELSCMTKGLDAYDAYKEEFLSLVRSAASVYGRY